MFEAKRIRIKCGGFTGKTSAKQRLGAPLLTPSKADSLSGRLQRCSGLEPALLVVRRLPEAVAYPLLSQDIGGVFRCLAQLLPERADIDADILSVRLAAPELL